MRREEDDFTVWRSRKENQASPFPHVYPDMPPRFRRCRRFTRTLFLLEWASLLTLIAGLLLEGVVILFRGIEKPMGDREALAAGLMLLVLLPLWFLIRWLRHTPRWFWHCPFCRQPLPYYAPDGRHEEMWEKECYYTLCHLRIGYVQTKLCPLVIPSECPWCRRKFFAIQGGSLDWDQERL